MASKEAKKIDRKVRNLQDKVHPDQVVQDVGRGGPFAEESYGLAQTGVPAEQFPADYTAKSSKDEMMAAKLALQQPDKPGVTDFGIATMQEDDLKWLLEKQRAAEEANFEEWFAKEYDRLDPASKEWAREALPGFYSKRQKLLREQTDNLYRLAQIKLHGIRSKEDLVLMYALSTGRLDVGPLKHLLDPETKDAVQDAQANFQRGLMNPRRFYFGDEGPGQNPRLRRERNLVDGLAGFKDVGTSLGFDTGFPPLGNKAGGYPGAAQGAKVSLGENIGGVFN